jgi:hypothetical protein
MPECLNQEIHDQFTVMHGDCCELVKSLPDDSIGFTVFSPPFASLYTYSDSERDMGNCASDEEFWQHFKFLIPELLRTTKPGRNCSVHCMNLPTTKQHSGYIGIRDFRGDVIRAFCDDEQYDMLTAIKRLERRWSQAMEEGDYKRCSKLQDAIDIIQSDIEHYGTRNQLWIYHSEVCIWKDPVTAMQRTKALGLLHKQLCKDSCMSRQGIPDYVCTFRKPGENTDPVQGELDYFAGDGETFRSEGRLSIDVWQRYASPVWMDINPSRTLQYRLARDNDDERHICPLQLDVIERCMQLWSNPGDIVLSPFAGIGSELYTAIKMGRKAVGFELKDSYYPIAVRHCYQAIEESRQQSLF